MKHLALLNDPNPLPDLSGALIVKPQPVPVEGPKKRDAAWWDEHLPEARDVVESDVCAGTDVVGRRLDGEPAAQADAAAAGVTISREILQALREAGVGMELSWVAEDGFVPMVDDYDDAIPLWEEGWRFRISPSHAWTIEQWRVAQDLGLRVQMMVLDGWECPPSGAEWGFHNPACYYRLHPCYEGQS